MPTRPIAPRSQRATGTRSPARSRESPAETTNRGEDLSYERLLARRIQQERERRGWSYERLARAASEAGCRMNQATPFKIEKGKPPRKITIDEFVAFAKVFDL